MPRTESSRLVIAGYGDIGARVARRIAAQQPMLAVNRRGLQAALPQPPRLWQGGLALLGPQLRSGDTLLWLAPPPKSGLIEPNLEQALAQAPDLARVVYLSTSGVYGDCGGAWVDESRPAAPASDRARRRWAAECCLQAWAEERGVPWAVARVPGIYGPGRLPEARIRAAKPSLSAALSPWSNRVHAEDLAAFLCLLLQQGQGVYNISDGQPGSITEYFHAVADALGLPRVPEVSELQALTPELASYMGESRRLDIRRARALGYQPLHTDLRAALPACVQPDLQWTESPSAEFTAVEPSASA
ncbi:MAG: NAD-dependent epimerase/dehydratase family protein [Oceanococcaceae bacterium]